MQLETITKSDLLVLRQEIVIDMKDLLDATFKADEWLKSKDVMKLLKCSPGSLQALKMNGTLPYSRVGGTLYFSRHDVRKVMEANKHYR